MKRLTALLIDCEHSTRMTGGASRRGRSTTPVLGPVHARISSIRNVPAACDATIRIVSRAAIVDPARWPNAWEERPTTVDALKTGDFVTVTTGDRDKVAVAVDVVRGEP